MDRLTKWEEANELWIENHDNDTRFMKNGYNSCMAKLAAYENTGLMPKEMIQFKAELEQYKQSLRELAIRITCDSCEVPCDDKNECIDAIEAMERWALAQAKAGGE